MRDALKKPASYSKLYEERGLPVMTNVPPTPKRPAQQGSGQQAPNQSLPNQQPSSTKR